LNKFSIMKVVARQVLDSRGNPTVEAEVHTKSGIGRAIVPSGASTGIYESVELRDNNKRYNGKGVTKAVRNVSLINKKVRGIDVRNQEDIDSRMIELDNTKNKKKLGANAVLAVSLATARAGAISMDLPLYRYLSNITKRRLIMPVPFANVVNGGKHADNDLNMQEFMIAPVNSKTFSEGVRAVVETYHVLKGLIRKKYGKNTTNVGDEGGFAPPVKKAEQVLDLITKAAAAAGHSREIRIAMDPAASEYYQKGKYILHKKYTGQKLTDYYIKLAKKYQIISIEDPFDQNDFSNFQNLTKKAKFQVVGDDLLVTNVDRIKIAAEKNLCNALLLKVNQIGSLSEAIASANLAYANKWNVMVSHRSGETEDSFIADLAVSLGCGQIKLGAPCRGERTAKYNQLLRIEEELGKRAVYGGFFK